MMVMFEKKQQQQQRQGQQERHTMTTTTLAKTAASDKITDKDKDIYSKNSITKASGVQPNPSAFKDTRFHTWHSPKQNSAASTTV